MSSDNLVKAAMLWEACPQKMGREKRGPTMNSARRAPWDPFAHTAQ